MRAKTRTDSILFVPVALGAIVRAALVAIAMIVRWAKLLTRGIRHRREATVLAHLDSRMLADIGLTRSDVRDAVATPVWEDPTSLLRARALERRLGRHGISMGVKIPSR